MLVILSSVNDHVIKKICSTFFATALLDDIQTQLQELSQYLPLILPPTSNSLQSELHSSTLSLVSIGTEEGPIQQESTPE